MNTQTLLSIVADQREELLANDYSELCLRPEESQLDLKSNRAQVVIGVRRCGKSTLCEMFLKQKGIDFAYVNFDDDRMEDMKASDLDLKQIELPVDEDVNPEDVEDNFVPQKRLSQEDMKELMSSESIPDPEFSGACTFEELGNVADVLLNRTTDKEKIMDAAETLYKLQDSDIYHFYTTSISTEKQVDRLLKDNLDGAGRRLNGMQSERIAVDWNKFM